MSEYVMTMHQPSQIHETVVLHDGAVVWPFTTILAGVSIGKHTTIGACCFLGQRSLIGNHCVLHTGVQLPAGTVIGDYVMLGPNVVLTDCLHPMLRHKAQEVHRPPVIEDDVVVGANAVILPGVVLHHGCLVGAGSVVTKDVLAGDTVAGNPARVMRRSAWLHEMIDGSVMA